MLYDNIPSICGAAGVSPGDEGAAGAVFVFTVGLRQ
jgi:hypothetical protein